MAEISPFDDVKWYQIRKRMQRRQALAEMEQELSDEIDEIEEVKENKIYA